MERWLTLGALRFGARYFPPLGRHRRPNRQRAGRRYNFNKTELLKKPITLLLICNGLILRNIIR